MATNRKRTPRSRRESNLSQEQLDWLYDRPDSDDFWSIFDDSPDKKTLWDANKDEVLKVWVNGFPCTRPSHWWLYDAPETPVKCRAFKCTQAQRERLGGVGTPRHEVLCIGPSFTLGIPDSWVSQQEADYYNGRAKDIHGAPIGTNYKEGHFDGLAIDPNDPPRYESQAAYLQRHGLLTTEEKAHLKKHPVLLEPEEITADA